MSSLSEDPEIEKQIGTSVCTPVRRARTLPQELEQKDANSKEEEAEDIRRETSFLEIAKVNSISLEFIFKEHISLLVK